MDVDEDGVINLDHVHKVIELLGTEHVRIPAKQIRQIIDMMAKEEMLEVEKKIEHILGNRAAAAAQPEKPADPVSAAKEKSPAPAQEEHFEEETVKAKSQNNGGSHPPK
jgi:ribosomal protein L12E/L44/L45/RPP1/RPP2